MANDHVLTAPSPSIVTETKVSSCSEADMEHIWSQFHLPEDITTWARVAKERSNRPPKMLVAFNKAIMKHGAHLSLHPLVRGMLAHFNLSLSQLNPNAYKILVGMNIL